MAAEYTVNYKINVDSTDAVNALNAFKTASDTLTSISTTLSTAATAVEALNTSINKLAAKKKVEIEIDITSAEARLKKFQELITTVKSQAAGITDALPKKNKGLITSLFGDKIDTENEIKELEKKVESINNQIFSINNKDIKPTADTKTAQGKLDKLLQTLVDISHYKTLSINASVLGDLTRMPEQTKPQKPPEVNIPYLPGFEDKDTGGGGSSSGNDSGKDKNKGKDNDKKPPKKKKTSESKSEAGHSKYLFPSTRQVLGPTYAGGGASMISEMVKGFGVAYGMSALTTGMAQVFQDAMTYDNITQSIENILRTHDTDPYFDMRFNRMNREMRDIGVQTKFTAPEVASAGKFLAMAGFNVDDIREAIKPITDIALVGDTDLGETADVVTNIMTSFEMLPEDVAKASDILTMTATKTNTTVMTLAESFKYAGTVAHQTGLSMEEVTAMFGVLGNAGIQGSLAGTSVRMSLLNMLKRPKRQQAAWDEIGVSPLDENGNMRNIIDILRDLHKKSEEMNPTKFAELIGTMFRVTAAPGALALIRNVDKIEEIKDANLRSGGIAAQLAFEKQNTIEGLWHQITSAFTETGITEFENMQSAIKDFMKEILAMMKSEEFAHTLRDGMQLMMQGAKAIKRLFDQIIGVFNAMPDGLKWFLGFFAEVQMWCGILAVSAKSVQATFVFLRGIVQGEWLGKSLYVLGSTIKGVSSAVLGLAKHFKDLPKYFKSLSKLRYKGSASHRAYEIGMNAKRLEYSDAVTEWTNEKRQFAPIERPGKYYSEEEVLRRAKIIHNARLKQKRKSIFEGQSKAESVADAAEAIEEAASLKDEIFKGKAGHRLEQIKKLTPLSAFSMLAKLMTTMSPAGIGIAATVGLGTAGFAGYQYYKKLAEEASAATKSMNDLADSYRKLGTDKIDVTKDDELIIGSMRIFNDTQLTQNERLQAAADLYKRLTKAKEDYGKQNEDATPYLSTSAAKDQFGSVLDWLNGSRYIDADASKLFKQLGISIGHERTNNVMGAGSDAYKLTFGNGASFMRQGSELGDDEWMQIMFAMYGADPNHPTIKRLNKDLTRNLIKATSVANFDQMVDSYQKSYYKSLEEVNSDYGFGISRSTFDKLSAAEWDKAPQAVAELKKQVDDIFKMWNTTFRPIYKMIEEGKAVDSNTAQNALGKILMVFNTKYGAFGSPEWIENWKKIQKDPTHSDEKFETEQEVVTAIQHGFQAVIDMYNNSSEQFKPWLASFISQTPWQNALLHPNDNPLGISTYDTSLYKEGQQFTKNGKVYTFRKTVIDNMRGAFYDKDGNIFTPQKADNSYTQMMGDSSSSLFGNTNAGHVDGHNGSNRKTKSAEEDYKSKYASASSAPKQVIVKIENLMNVNSIDLTKKDNSMAVNGVKEQLVAALNEVVSDFADNQALYNI